MTVVNRDTVTTENGIHFADNGSASSFDTVQVEHVVDGVGVDRVGLDDILVVAHGEKVDTLGENVGGITLGLIGLDEDTVAHAGDALNDGKVENLLNQGKEEKLGCLDIVLQLDGARVALLRVELELCNLLEFAYHILLARLAILGGFVVRVILGIGVGAVLHAHVASGLGRLAAFIFVIFVFVGGVLASDDILLGGVGSFVGDLVAPVLSSGGPLGIILIIFIVVVGWLGFGVGASGCLRDFTD